MEKSVENVANPTTLPSSVRSQPARPISDGNNQKRRENSQYRHCENNPGQKEYQNRKPSRQDDRKSNRKFADGKPQIQHVERTGEPRIPVPLTVPMTRTSSNTSKSNKQLE